MITMTSSRTTQQFGVAIRQARRSRGWTQAELAERAAVSRPALIGLERGNPRGEIGIAFRVLAALGHQIELVPTPAAGPSVLDDILRDLGDTPSPNSSSPDTP